MKTIIIDHKKFMKRNPKHKSKSTRKAQEKIDKIIKDALELRRLLSEMEDECL